MTDKKKNGHTGQEQFYIGVDGGASKCKAVIIDADNQILGTGISGPGNPVHGLQDAKNAIVDSASKALVSAKKADPSLTHIQLNDIPAGLGLAGVNIPSCFRQIAEWDSPFRSQHLTTDLSIACLGAHSGQDGAVIVSGTGSCGYVHVGEHSHIIGAHGFPQGDKGSGAWFGLKAVESVLLFLDGMGPDTRITHHIFEAIKARDPELLVSHVMSKSPSAFAGLAHCVFNAAAEKDQVALQILNDGVSYLECMANALLQYHPPRISFIGGMASNITPFFSTRLRNTLSPPLHPPEIGAALYAKNRLSALN